MDQFGGPAALGGVISNLMLGAWMLGRWQSGLMPDAPRHDTMIKMAQPLAAMPGADAASPPVEAQACQQAAREERRAVLEIEASLGELHADISAYRLAQQILTDVAITDSRFERSGAEAGETCRYLGISGHPTCPVSRAAPAHCGSGRCGAGWRPAPLRTNQPSPEAPRFTRV